MPPSATPLKVGSTSNTPARPAAPERSGTATPSASGAGKAATPAGAPPDISSPHELTAFVENLLEQLDSKFDEMSTQILDRMNQMSSRVDALEASIQDIINTDVAVMPSGSAQSNLGSSAPPSPLPNGVTPRRMGSGLS